MVSESRFDSIFDYNSTFNYHSVASVPKSINHSQYNPFSYHSINITTDKDTDDIKDENWISSVLRKVITVLLYIFVIASFPLSFWICVKKVHALERLVLMRLGKLQPIRGPGLTLVLPLIDIWTRVDLRPQAFTLSTSQLLTADGGIVEVESEVEFRVSDIVGYVTRLSRQEKCLKDLGLCCLTNLVSGKDQEDLVNKREYVGSLLKHELNRASRKWGLEILDVHMCSVKVLKDAEPVDALGTLMTALKAATGHSSDHATAVSPLVPLDDNLSTQKASADPVERDESILDTLKKVLSAAEGGARARDVTGRFKFDVVGSETNTVYCTFENGHASVVDDPGCSLEPDVSLVLTEDNAKDFLSNKMSPLQAYMGGKVRVTGDWNLLRPLAEVLEEQLSA